MIVDTSAVAAILLGEPEREHLAEVLAAAHDVSMGAPNWLELCMVIDRRGHRGASVGLESVLKGFGIEVVAFEEPHAAMARAAFRAYGRGNGHPARLNFGDCMAYALAKVSGRPLLFKGGDFIHTDVVAAA